MLFQAGAIEPARHRRGRHDGLRLGRGRAAPTDVARGVLCHVEWQGRKINLIDAPGDAGFQADTIAAPARRRGRARRRLRRDGRRGEHRARVGARRGARALARRLREHARPRARRLLPRRSGALQRAALRPLRRDPAPDRRRARADRHRRPAPQLRVHGSRPARARATRSTIPARAGRRRRRVPREAARRRRRDRRGADGALPRRRGDRAARTSPHALKDAVTRDELYPVALRRRDEEPRHARAARPARRGRSRRRRRSRRRSRPTRRPPPSSSRRSPTRSPGRITVFRVSPATSPPTRRSSTTATTRRSGSAA